MNEHDVYVPRNPQEAINQANRLQRAKNLIAEGYTFTYDAELETVFVTKPGELHAAYTIGPQVDGTDGCSCPDRAKGNKCKHEMAWELIQAERADEAKMWESICAEHDARMEEEGGTAFKTAMQKMRNLLHAELIDAENTAAKLNSEPFLLQVGGSKLDAQSEPLLDCPSSIR